MEETQNEIRSIVGFVRDNSRVFHYYWTFFVLVFSKSGINENDKRFGFRFRGISVFLFSKFKAQIFIVKIIVCSTVLSTITAERFEISTINLKHREVIRLILTFNLIFQSKTVIFSRL